MSSGGGSSGGQTSVGLGSRAASDDLDPSQIGRSVLVKPFVEYGHARKRCYSVVGGVVYRGALFPELRGRYIFGDLCGGMWSVRLSGPGARRSLRRETFGALGILTSIGENADARAPAGWWRWQNRVSCTAVKGTAASSDERLWLADDAVRQLRNLPLARGNGGALPADHPERVTAGR